MLDYCDQQQLNKTLWTIDKLEERIIDLRLCKEVNHRERIKSINKRIRELQELVRFLTNENKISPCIIKVFI